MIDLDVALAREFRRKPRGRQSPALQHLLSVMRLPENCLDLMIVAVEPYRLWVVAKVVQFEQRPEYLPGAHRLLEDADWAVFKMRWKKLGGGDINDIGA